MSTVRLAPREPGPPPLSERVRPELVRLLADALRRCPGHAATPAAPPSLGGPNADSIES